MAPVTSSVCSRFVWYELTRYTCDHPLPPMDLSVLSTFSKAFSISALRSEGNEGPSPFSLSSHPPISSQSRLDKGWNMEDFSHLVPRSQYGLQPVRPGCSLGGRAAIGLHRHNYRTLGVTCLVIDERLETGCKIIAASSLRAEIYFNFQLRICCYLCKSTLPASNRNLLTVREFVTFATLDSHRSSLAHWDFTAKV